MSNLPPSHFAHLSFDGRGINDRDEYRSRIATFARPSGSPDDAARPAKEFGHLFAASPEMLIVLQRLLRALEWSVQADRLTPEEQAKIIRLAIDRAEGQAPSEV